MLLSKFESGSDYLQQRRKGGENGRRDMSRRAENREETRVAGAVGCDGTGL